jgi:glycosyltransferase involved in cell wall biosynthesis
MLEAMALESIVVGSKTGPVEEIIKDKVNGLLVDFFDINEISSAVNDVLHNPEKYKKIKKNARKTIIDKYDLKKVSLPKQLNLIKDLLNEKN